MTGKNPYTKLNHKPHALPQRISSNRTNFTTPNQGFSAPRLALQNANTSPVVTKLIVSHLGGAICLFGVIAILVSVHLAQLPIWCGVHLRGFLNILIAWAASVCAHKLSSSVGVQSLKGNTNDVLIQAALGQTSLMNPALEYTLFYGLAYIEAACSAAASFLAGAAIADEANPASEANEAILTLKSGYVFPLLGICGAWAVALVLHAVLAFTSRRTLALLNKSTTTARIATASSLSLL